MSNNVSHNTFASYSEAKTEILSRICDNSHLLSLLDELESCGLGRFLIQHRGLDAYWTKKITENKGSYENDFETELVTTTPAFVATQQRSMFFKQQVAALDYGAHIMSVPAGLLPEFTQKLIEEKSFKIDAYDLDPKCPTQTDLSKLANVDYFVKDIFDVDIPVKYSAAISNGLNIYLSSNDDVERFYQIIAGNLGQNGVLITSFIKDIIEVDNTQVNQEYMQRSKDIFVDILDIGWKKTHCEQEFIEILLRCGLEIKDIIYDVQKMFPTVVAIKR